MENLKAVLINFWTARLLVIVGCIYGYKPIKVTFSHIGKENYLLTEIAHIPSHSYYHYFREGVGDVAAIVVILTIMFIMMVGIYAPFWIGMPFNSDLSGPHLKAEIAHLKMAIPSVIGCFLARRYYYEAQ